MNELGVSKTQSEIILTFGPGLEGQKYPRTFMYEHLMVDDVPLKWKGGKPPADRDATEKDITFKGSIVITGNSVTARW